MKRIVLVFLAIVGFTLFARYASATNPCNTKAYKQSMQSHSYSYQTTSRTTKKQTKAAEPRATATQKKTTGKNRRKSKGIDASDYVHPDDFYYDYHDDFSDYEEAEDYYYHHGGK